MTGRTGCRTGTVRGGATVLMTAVPTVDFTAAVTCGADVGVVVM